MNKILDAAMRLEEWREHFNGEEIGLGFDVLHPTVKHHHAKAYAFFARGYLELYKYLKDDKWLSKAKRTLDALENLQIHDGCWGFKFLWKAWNIENECYLITTVQVLHAFLDAYEATFNKNYLTIVKKGINWVTMKLGKDEDGCFKYSPRINLQVWNPHMMFIGVLYRYLRHVNNDELRRIAEDGLKFTMAHQGENGLWGYGPEDPVRYDSHSTYILEGLHHCGEPISEHWHRLMAETLNTKGELRDLRCVAYASNIHVGVLINDTEYLPKLISYVFENLQAPDGSFYQTNIDHRLFIRTQSKMFHSLTVLLNAGYNYV